MSEAEDRRDQETIPQRQSFPDAYPPEDYRTLAGEYPWLSVAAGLGAGLLIGALLPRGTGGKFGKRALAAASLAAEVGLALTNKAGDAVEEAGREGLRRVGEAAQPLRNRAARSGASARSAGLNLAREALRIARRVRQS